MKRFLTNGLPVLLVAVIAFAIGRGTATGPATGEPGDATESAVEWTCPMHPSVRLPQDDPCPICGMDLVVMDTGAGVAGDAVELGPGALALAGVRTTEVRRATARRSVRLVGHITRDETTLRTVSANVPGRIERLFVDREGVIVDAGEHLFEIYSPSLFSAQTELVQVLARMDERRGSTGGFVDDSLLRNYQSARDKLKLYGLGPEQIDAIERSRDANQTIEVRSPVKGTVVARHVEQGDYVIVGSPIYELAGLDHLWLELEAHEQDLPFLAYGQRVVAELEALPGEPVRGQIAFLDPELDPATRTVSMRVHVHNPEGRLRPGMFARATVMAELDAEGRALRPDLAGLWVSPMHPEVVSDGPGQCTVCGMDLVPAESLGLGAAGNAAGMPLVIPESAVLWTGRRAVTYVATDAGDAQRLELREVVLGPRVDDAFVVLAGLEAGERVVSEGAFRVDAEMQLRGRRSMLSMPADPGPGAGPEGAAFRASLAPALEDAVALQAALAADDLDGARVAVARLVGSSAAVDPGMLPRRGEDEGRAFATSLAEAVAVLEASSEIEALRAGFEPVSEAVLGLLERFGAPGQSRFVEVHCPMAFDDRGASWLQAEGDVANPYFGARMLRCGDKRRTHVGVDPPRGDDSVAPTDEDVRAALEQTTLSAPVTSADHSDVWNGYLDATVALAADDPLGALAALDALAIAAREAAAEDEAHATLLETLAAAADDHGPAPAMDALRASFEGVSDAARALLDAAGNLGARDLRVAFCPMAFDNRGARWVQAEDELANPYFGAMMLRCGVFEQELAAR